MFSYHRLWLFDYSESFFGRRNRMKHNELPPSYPTIFLVGVSLLILSIPIATHAQQWSGILDSSRANNWNNAGVVGGIPQRTTVCSTLSPGATAAQINAAISSCQSGQVVYLNAGTYNLTSGLMFNAKSNVTLRGAGPDATLLKFTGSVGCVLASADVCVYVSSVSPTNPDYTANWTAGYAQGATSITLSSTAGLAVGTLLNLDQRNDSSTDNGQLWQCVDYPYCATEGDSGLDRPGRTQGQQVTVTSINGATVGITPGLYMPNWRSGQSPGAWWADTTISGVGIEDLSIDNSASNSMFNIQFGGARDSWVKNVRSINSDRAHVLGYSSARITVRDSYFYGTRNALSQSYGGELNMSSGWLFENNIYQHVTGPMQPGQQGSGIVYGYNFAVDDYYTGASWMQASAYHHAAGINYVLFEGNDGISSTADAIHGTSHFMTAFRNFWPGWEPGKSLQTIPFHNYAFNRYFNVIGNVLGRAGYHSNYECYASTQTGDCNKQEISIYVLGFAGNQQYHGVVPNDPLVRTRLLRWGNYDVVNNAVRFDSAEVPSGISPYGNPVPATQTLPASFYHAAQPSAWWKTPWGTPPWPAIGPDVTGGPVTSGTGTASALGGRVHKIPARLCFENTPLDGANPWRRFNANNCYQATSVLPAPSNLRVL